MPADLSSGRPSASRSRIDALLVATFPLLLSVGVVLIPVVSDYSNHQLAERASAQEVRWLMGHLISAAAFGAAVLGAAVLRRRLVPYRPGGVGWLITLVLALGAGLHAAGLGADAVGPLATRGAGVGARTFFEGSATWVRPIFIAGAVLFGIGQIALAWQAVDHLLTGPRKPLVRAGAIVFSAAEAIPSGWGLYLVALSALATYLPFAGHLWREHPAENGIADTTGIANRS